MSSHIRTLADFVGNTEPDIFSKTQRLQDYIDDHRKRGWYTYCRVVEGANDPIAQVHDERTGQVRPMVMFSTNNYLGLASDPRVVRAAQDAAATFGVGVGGSPLICGTTRLHRMLEERLAAWENCEDAILFPSGYAANLGTISALLRPKDVVLADRLVHASIIDGCAFSNSQIVIFRHNDITSLAGELEKLDDDVGKLIIAEGVYSMDGDIAPLPGIVDLARRHGARVLLDEAHATGVIGTGGHGSVEHWGVEHRPDLLLGTMSKSLGSMGGFVAGDRDVIDYLRLYSRSHFFSTGLTAPQVAAALASLEIIEQEPWRVERLRTNSDYLRQRLTEVGLVPIGSGTPIIPVMIGDESVAYEVGRRLHDAGAFATPIPFPAVPRNRARVRLSVMATHEQSHIDLLVDILDKVCRDCNVPRYMPTRDAA